MLEIFDSTCITCGGKYSVKFPIINNNQVLLIKPTQFTDGYYKVFLPNNNHLILGHKIELTCSEEYFLDNICFPILFCCNNVISCSNIIIKNNELQPIHKLYEYYKVNEIKIDINRECNRTMITGNKIKVELDCIPNDSQIKNIEDYILFL